MQVDAQGMAAQLAAYEVMPFENRYYNKLDTSMAKSDAMSSIKSIMTKMDGLVYDFTKYNASATKSSATASSDEFLDVSASDGADSANMSVFVEQLASRHQIGFATGATDQSEVFSTAAGTVTVNIDGVDHEIDIAGADGDGDGDVTYAEFVSAFNDQMEGEVSASVVQSSSGISLTFASEETGAASQFTIAASAETGQTALFDAASANPLQEAKDAIIWLGGQGSGLEMTNSSNTFENLVNGVDITVKKANAVGDVSTVVKSEKDVAGSIEGINEFVASFNELLAEINSNSGTGTESSSRGALASDPTIRGLKSQMQGLVRSEFGGVRMYELGLEIDREGKLTLDSEKFEEALDTVDVDAALVGETGFFGAVEGLIETYTDRSEGLISRSIESLESEQRRYNDALEGLNDKYDMYYTRYLNQYTQLNLLSSEMDNMFGMF